MNPIMNIEGDYLWDRTGEPDPEIQQLEEILGTRRYQPRPLEIPAGLQANLHIRRERQFFRGFVPRLAIAAAIAMLVLGLGLWLGLQRLQRHQPTDIVKTPSTPGVNSNPNPATAPSPNQDLNASDSGPDQKHIDAPRRHRANPSLLAGNTNRYRDAARKAAGKDAVKDVALAENDLQEAAAAKDQLMLGLRVACAKLSFAQKKTQETTNPRDLIHNQHKIG
jgi:hypothetical protein